MARTANLFAADPDRVTDMKRLLAPWTLGMHAARHVAWYVNYQLSGETRVRPS
jgi:hypothetical protein